ncbi:hypothetical protein M514_15550 [Trichuris suis]|uniref:Uncharacterized protein n=1 Tax=Trichuris suis TaxID=68888 RepID=A0A085NS31_9BILA|nr:hypothetical protein M514_15550 [Trichuris suis]
MKMDREADRKDNNSYFKFIPTHITIGPDSTVDSEDGGWLALECQSRWSKSGVLSRCHPTAIL